MRWSKIIHSNAAIINGTIDSNDEAFTTVLLNNNSKSIQSQIDLFPIHK